MSLKLAAVCPACPMTFTAKHREQIREMVEDHLHAHYAILEEVKRDKAVIERVKKLLETTEGVGIASVDASALREAFDGPAPISINVDIAGESND